MIIEMSQQQYAAFLGISEGEMSKRITRSEPLAGFLSVKQFGRFRVFTVDNEAIVRRSKKRSKKLAK